MKKFTKNLIAAAMAGCLSVSSTVGAFASVSRTPSLVEDGDQRRVVASFVHGSEYVNSGGAEGAGYNFAMSGLPNAASVKAGNFIKLYAIDPSVSVTNNTVGNTVEGDILYCLCPNQPVNVNYGTGYLVTAHSESESGIESYLPVALTETGLDILRKAVAVTYTGRLELKWQYVAHHGQYEWVEYAYPYADYPEGKKQDGQDITENKIACQILVWMAAMGWLDKNHPEYETTALNIFLKEMRAKYPDEAARVESYYRIYKGKFDNLGDDFENISSVYGIETYMKKNPQGYKDSYGNSTYSYFEIPLNGSEDEINKHFNLRKAITDALEAQGLKRSDFSIDFNGKMLTLGIKKSVPKNEFEIEITTEHLVGNSPYASQYYKELVVLDGGSQQNLVTLTPKTTSFKLYREGEPLKLKLRKTFEGIASTETGIDTSKFAFVLFNAENNRWLNFDLKDGVYSYNGTTARNGNAATQLLLNSFGEIELEELPSGGDYYFIETKAPANWSKMVDQMIAYEPDADGTFIFDNHGDGTGHLVFNKCFYDLYGAVQYTKDSTGADKERYTDGIKNLKFELEGPNGKISVTGSNGKYTYSESGGNTQMQLDENGQLYVDQLPTGVYKIAETLPKHWKGENGEKEGEKVYTELINVSLNEATTVEERHQRAIELGNVGSLNNYYDQIFFDLEVTKESEDGNVEDFEFTVTNSNGEVVGVMTTNESGWASLKGLPMYKADGVTLETYTLTETRKLPYDELPPIEFTGIPGEDILYLGAEDGIFNRYTRRNLGVVKRSEDGIVSGIEFTINAIDPDTMNVVETYTIVTEQLAMGTYNGSEPIGYGELLGLPVYNEAGTGQLIYEITEDVPLRYKDVTLQQTVLDPDLALTEVVFENKLKYTNLYIMKWADDYQVEGLEFMCVGDDGNTYTATSDRTGLVTFRDLLVYNEYDRKINYTVFEVNTPDRYYVPEVIENITLFEIEDAAKNYYEIENNTKYGEITITKVDEDHNGLNGASFALYSTADYDANGESARMVSAKTSDKNGIVTFKKLSVNKEYVVVEKIAPKGYEKTAEPYRFTITDADEPTEYKIGYEWVNEKPKALEILKVDEDTDKPLMGAVFTLYQENGDKVATKMSGKDGKASFENLEAGKYRLVEDKAPIGYQLPDPHEWEISVTEASDPIIRQKIANKGETLAGVTIYKIDEETNEPLEGAVFELYTNVGEGATAKRTLYGTASSDADGIARFENIPNGSYTLTETKAPSGYQVTKEMFDFVVDDDHKSFTYSVTNAKSASFSIHINKIDSKTKDAIANATFALYNKTDNRYIYNDVKTDTKGMITFDKDIEFGKEYVVLETAVSDPDSYVLPDGGITVKATENGKVYEITSSTLKGAETVTAMRIGANGRVIPLVIEQTWENTPPVPEEEYGNLKIRKSSYDGTLEGFIFEARGGGKTYKNLTNDKGEIVFKHLPVKDANGDLIEYEVTEVRTKDVDAKYAPISPQTATLEKDKEITVSFENKEIEDKTANIRVIKTSDDNHVRGIKVTLKSSAGLTLTEYTDGSGYAEFHNLPVYDSQDNYISYTITEELTDEEARKYTELAPVAIERLVENYTTDVSLNNSSKDIKKEIRLIKVDGTTDQPVEGAEFCLYLDDICKISVATGTSKIDTKLNSLTEGKSIVSFTGDDGLMTNTTYYLKETKAPKAPNGKSYTLSNVIYECRIDEYGKASYRVYGSGDEFSAEFPVCENYTETTESIPAKIIKVDADTGNPLEGAQFGLYSDEKCTKQIETAVSKIDSDKNSDTYNKAVVSFDTELNKTYYIKETKAPSGYKASENVFKAVVNDKGRVTYSIVGKNGEFASFPVCENKKIGETTVTTAPTTTTTPDVTTMPDGTTTPGGTTPSGGTTPRITTTPGGTTPSRGTTPRVTTIPGGTTTTTVKNTTTTTKPGDTTTTPSKTTPGGSTTPAITTVPNKRTTPKTTTAPGQTTPNKKTTTAPVVTTPSVTMTRKTTTKTDDNPETGVGMNTAGLIAVAVLSGIACVAFLTKGARSKKRKDEEDN